MQRTGTRTPVSLSFSLGALEERKSAAFEKHASQRGVLERVRAEFPDVLTKEGYLLAAARCPSAEEQDLWDGVVEE